MPNKHQSKLPPPLVILSEAKDLARGTEMLRCTQHDNALSDCRAYVDAYWSRLIVPT